MKVILVDDEPMMHLIMRKMLLKFPSIQVVDIFASTKAAGEYLSDHADIELAFVDISMPGETGLMFASRMEAAKHKVQIVFVTSHREYAIQAFELSAMDYLIKPVSQERLERTINRALAAREALGASTQQYAAGGESEEIFVTMLGDVYVGTKKGRVKWISGKCAELFAYLLLNRGKRIARTRLIADIFGGMTRESAEKYLNTTVYQLRKSLEPLGLREVVLSENDGYALELNNAFIDYEEFERRAGSQGSIAQDDVDSMLETERMYTGDLFGDKAYVWAIYEIERLAQSYTTFVLRLSEALLSLQNIPAAMKLLLQLYTRNPFDEMVVRQLMKLHAQDGNKKGLTVQYTDYVKLLNKVLGIRPSQELLWLYDSLVSGLSEGVK